MQSHRRRWQRVLLVLVFPAALLGIWFVWARPVAPLLIAAADALNLRRKRTARPAEPAKRVLRWYPSWW